MNVFGIILAMIGVAFSLAATICAIRTYVIGLKGRVVTGEVIDNEEQRSEIVTYSPIVRFTRIGGVPEIFSDPIFASRLEVGTELKVIYWDNSTAPRVYGRRYTSCILVLLVGVMFMIFSNIAFDGWFKADVGDTKSGGTKSGQAEAPGRIWQNIGGVVPLLQKGLDMHESGGTGQTVPPTSDSCNHKGTFPVSSQHAS